MASEENTTSSVTAKQGRGNIKARDGIVVSNKMDKTVVVAVTRSVKHRAYGKYIKRTKKYVAHDQDNQCSIGDMVRLVESRPLSKRKRWSVTDILRKAV